MTIDLLIDEALKTHIGGTGKAKSHWESSVLNKYTKPPNAFTYQTEKYITYRIPNNSGDMFGRLGQKCTPSLIHDKFVWANALLNPVCFSCVVLCIDG